MHEGDTAATTLYSTAATMGAGPTADVACGRLGVGTAKLATDVAADVVAAAVGAAISRLAAVATAPLATDVAADVAAAAVGAQPTTATTGSVARCPIGTSFNDCVGRTSFNDCVGRTRKGARCAIGCGSVCTIGGTAKSSEGRGTRPRSAGPTVCNFS